MLKSQFEHAHRTTTKLGYEYTTQLCPRCLNSIRFHVEVPSCYNYIDTVRSSVDTYEYQVDGHIPYQCFLTFRTAQKEYRVRTLDLELMK